MDLSEVVFANTVLKLRHGVNEGSGLNIANSTTKLDNADIGLILIVTDWDSGDTLDPFLNGVGDMGDTRCG